MLKSIHNFELKIDLKTMMSALTGGRHADRLESDANWSLTMIEKYAQPEVIVDLFNVYSHSSTEVFLKRPDGSEDLLLRIGPKANLLAKAHMAQVSLSTLGPRLDQLRNELREDKKELRAFVLDTAAVLALGVLGQKINQLAEIEAASRNWGVGRRMAPGSLKGWTMEDQKHLANLLPKEKLGVSITPGGMLVPLKSATAVIGMGPDYSSQKVGTVCQWCKHEKTCIARHLPPYH